MKSILRILVVEDEEWRIKWFRQHYIRCDVTGLVSTAINWLKTRQYDVLFLDHDLGTDPVVGRDVGEWLAAHHAVLPTLQIIVHSMNVISAPKIVADLAGGGRSARWVPFTEMIKAAIL